MKNKKKLEINYKQEIKKLLIIFACLIGYDLISIWAFNCTGSKAYETDLYPGGIHGLGDLIGKILNKANYLANDNITTFAMIFYLIINVLLLGFIAFRYLDSYFTITTAAAALFLPLMGVFLQWQVKEGFLSETERFFDIFKTESNFLSDSLRAIFAGLFTGVFNGIVIKIGSSTGGIDIVGKYLLVYKRKNIASVIQIFSYILVFIGICASFFYFQSLLLDQLLLGIFCALLRIQLTVFVIGLMNPIDSKNKKLCTQIQQN
ncbi:YitT family protein [Candidatus Phytoplasma solani]|uniref:YitT family protein n=1 Tax=Candidatus Phytoplasma solani TaxID=69896 RepID=UPI00358FE0ED